MGLPALTLILAKNQEQIAIELEKHGATLNLGWHNLIDSSTIADKLHSLTASQEKRSNMSSCGRKLVDGRGAMRVIQQLNGCKFSLRPVTEKDCRLIWEWANDPITRAQSFSTENIPWEKHIAWFESKLNDPLSSFFIMVDKNNVSLGQIRYQITNQEADVSISIAPDERGKGYGAEIIKMGAQELWLATDVNKINSYIKEENKPSVKAFTRAGFTRAGTTEVKGYQALHYVLERN